MGEGMTKRVQTRHRGQVLEAWPRLGSSEAGRLLEDLRHSRMQPAGVRGVGRGGERRSTEAEDVVAAGHEPVLLGDLEADCAGLFFLGAGWRRRRWAGGRLLMLVPASATAGTEAHAEVAARDSSELVDGGSGPRGGRC